MANSESIATKVLDTQLLGGYSYSCNLIPRPSPCAHIATMYTCVQGEGLGMSWRLLQPYIMILLLYWCMGLLSAVYPVCHTLFACINLLCMHWKTSRINLNLHIYSLFSDCFTENKCLYSDGSTVKSSNVLKRAVFTVTPTPGDSSALSGSTVTDVAIPLVVLTSLILLVVVVVVVVIVVAVFRKRSRSKTDKCARCIYNTLSETIHHNYSISYTT